MPKRYNSPPNWPTPPSGWTPPQGWKSDPNWGPEPEGWQFWSEEAPVPQSWFARHKVLTGIGAFVLLCGVINAFGSNDKQADVAVTTPSASSTRASEKTVETTPKPEKTESAPADTEQTVDDAAAGVPDDAYGRQPKDQKAFVEATIKAQAAGEDADNDMKQGSALSKRNKSLCDTLDGGRVSGWTGEIASLDANSDGLGVVEIKIAEDVHVATWNNAFSDYADGTLIPPGRLFDDFLELKVGQVVEFGGTFVRGESCVNDSRLSLTGKLSDPKFIFKFSAVEPAS